ncbi:MAG: acetamidase/formamidase family protein [Defluviitaleaceae bacterium]|nr:acetamidase/formamidase family protein [Defluviitaleaceae bacterium]
MFKLSKEHSIYSMSPNNEPVLYVPPNAQIEFETCDCFENQIKSSNDSFGGLDWSRINPATGPVYINGAEPGDILSVRIDKIEVAESGVMVAGKEMGPLGHLMDAHTIKIIPIKNNTAIFSDKIRLPLNKMIGVIGVAPKDSDIACGVPDYHGGNMDCKEITEGAVLHLPVNVPGGLLALGDLHAVMADGEICICGVEVAGKVTVSIDIIKNTPLPSPMLFTNSHIMTIASHEDLDEAVNIALLHMANYLKDKYGLPMDEAVMLMSLAAQVRICQVVDPKKTIRVEFPKDLLSYSQQT